MTNAILKYLTWGFEMKRNIFFVFITFVFLANSLIFCGRNTVSNDETDINYRQEMRNFVQRISAYAKGINPAFIIIPQNGHDLITDNGEGDGQPVIEYLSAIDGIGREDLYYGYDNDNVATSDDDTNSMIPFLDIAENNSVEVLVTDYCSTHTFMDDSYSKNETKGYISFAADRRELDNIPNYLNPITPNNTKSTDITQLANAKNFLYLINPSDNTNFSDKYIFINAVIATNYDLLITDLFYDGSEATELTSSEISQLKSKVNTGTRLVIAYMSIGEAEDYRYYWQAEWESNPPTWVEEENPDWEGNYKVRYWDNAWQSLIYGNDNSYLKKILDAGFDGVYLDIIDAFEYFENKKKQGGGDH